MTGARRVLARTLMLLMLARSAVAAPVGAPAPAIETDTWLNSEPLTLASLRGQVVLVEFWTFDCYNCRNVEPYVKDWYARYRERGFIVVAVHSPEFAHERDVGNVRRYVERRGIDYPVAIDNNFAIWKRYANRYWPAMYFIDRRGILRHIRIGEGGYARSATLIETLLAEPAEAP